MPTSWLYRSIKERWGTFAARHLAVPGKIILTHNKRIQFGTATHFPR